MNKSSHVLSNEKSKEKFLEVPSKPIHHKSTEKSQITAMHNQVVTLKSHKRINDQLSLKIFYFMDLLRCWCNKQSVVPIIIRMIPLKICNFTLSSLFLVS